MYLYIATPRITMVMSGQFGAEGVFAFWRRFEVHVGVDWILEHHRLKAKYFKLRQDILLVLFNKTAAALPHEKTGVVTPTPIENDPSKAAHFFARYEI